jgi:hypothetical protein
MSGDLRSLAIDVSRFGLVVKGIADLNQKPKFLQLSMCKARYGYKQPRRHGSCAFLLNQSRSVDILHVFLTYLSFFKPANMGCYPWSGTAGDSPVVAFHSARFDNHASGFIFPYNDAG